MLCAEFQVSEEPEQVCAEKDFECISANDVSLLSPPPPPFFSGLFS